MSRRWVVLGFLLALLTWSGIRPVDQFTWFLEVLPVLVVGGILFGLRRHFVFTDFVLLWLSFHAVVLIIGGHYTYAEVPLFNWIRDEFGLARNHYDRVGHFFQGFVPALVAREVFIRRQVVRRGAWLFFLVVSVCLAFSACYEFFEWGMSLLSGEAADAFLGSQGDVWDTQWDMFLAFCGANTALIFLSKSHDRALESIAEPRNS